MKAVYLRLVAVQLLLTMLGACWQATARAEADGPWLMIGTWKLNIAKSKFNASPPPQSLVLKFERDGDQVKHTADRVTAKGEKLFTGWLVNADGEGAPLKGATAEWDHVTLKKVDEYTSDVTLKKAGKELMTFRRIVARDGKSVTITRKDNTVDPNKVNVEVYDKQ